MSRSTVFPIVGVVIALAVLWFIFFASRPEEISVEDGGVGQVADDPGMLGVAEGSGEED